MTKTREIMNSGAVCIGEHDTLQAAARMMRDKNIGALPICGDDDRLHGMITDRDIVVRCIAGGLDPAVTTAGELAQETIFTVDADAELAEIVQLMEERHIRRVPVLEGRQLVGMISSVDLGGLPHS